MSLATLVLVDGKEIARDADAYTAHDLTVLDGLTVRWGRASRIDQPRASTLSLALALPEGIAAHTAMDRIYPGARIEVQTRTTARARYRRLLMRSTATTIADATARPVWADPLTPVEPGTLPTAWNAIPVADEGSVFALSAVVSDIPEGARLRIHPVICRGPWFSAHTIRPHIGETTTVGAYSVDYTPDPGDYGAWIGVAVSGAPDGTTWSAAAGTWATQTRTWAATTGITLASVEITRDGPDARTVTVFAGRVTDAPVTYDTDKSRPVMTLTAQDVTGDLANARISAEPWPMQPARQRLAQIARSAPLYVSTILDADPHGLTLAPRDVDGTSAAQLLTDVANSLGFILWPQTSRSVGDYIRFEDPSTRAALYSLQVPASGPVTIETSRDSAIRVPASQILRDGLAVERDTTDLATCVVVGWKDISLDDQGKETITERRETLTSPALLSQIGYRALSVSTELPSAAAAQDLAARLLARSAPGGWGIPAAEWETDRGGPDLLNGRSIQALYTETSTILVRDATGKTIRKPSGVTNSGATGRLAAYRTHWITLGEQQTIRIRGTLTNTGTAAGYIDVGGYIQNGATYVRSIWQASKRKTVQPGETLAFVEDIPLAAAPGETHFQTVIYAVGLDSDLWLSAFTVEDVAAPLVNEDDVLAALDASTRPGLPLLLDGVDEWVPGSPLVPVYLDGGTYTYADGAWTLAMTLTRAAQAADSLTWTQLPAPVTWDRMTALSWADLSSVHA